MSLEQEKIDLLEKIKEFSENNIVVVEGKNDVKALKKHDIHSIEIDDNIYLFAEKNSENKKKVLILTDFDSKGKQLRMKLKRAFSRFGVEENTMLREEFSKVFRLSHIEGL